MPSIAEPRKGKRRSRPTWPLVAAMVAILGVPCILRYRSSSPETAGKTAPEEMGTAPPGEEREQGRSPSVSGAEAGGSSDTDPWRNEVGAGEAARKRWRLLDAEKHFLAAAGIARATGLASLRLAESYFLLGDVYGAMERIPEAIVALHRALEIEEGILGRESIGLVKILDRLGELRVEAAGRSREEWAAEGRGFYERALAIREKALGPDHPEVVTAIERLGRSYRNLPGDGDKGEALLRKALAMRRAAPSRDDAAVAGSMEALAEYLGLRGNHREAEDLFEGAIAIRKQRRDADPTALAGALQGMAVLLIQRERYDEAEPLLREAVEVRSPPRAGQEAEPFLGWFHLTSVYARQGRLIAAERAAQAALEADEAEFGADSHLLARDLLIRGMIAWEQENAGQAERDFRRALAISHAYGIPELYRSSETNLSRVLRETGRDQEAGKLEERKEKLVWERVREMIEGLEDPDPVVRLAMVSGLAELGSDAKVAVPKLEGLLGDEDEEVRAAARSALQAVAADSFAEKGR